MPKSNTRSTLSIFRDLPPSPEALFVEGQVVSTLNHLQTVWNHAKRGYRECQYHILASIFTIGQAIHRNAGLWQQFVADPFWNDTGVKLPATPTQEEAFQLALKRVFGLKAAKKVSKCRVILVRFVEERVAAVDFVEELRKRGGMEKAAYPAKAAAVNTPPIRARQAANTPHIETKSPSPSGIPKAAAIQVAMSRTRATTEGDEFILTFETKADVLASMGRFERLIVRAELEKDKQGQLTIKSLKSKRIQRTSEFTAHLPEPKRKVVYVPNDFPSLPELPSWVRNK